MLCVPIDKVEYSIVGLHVALLSAFWKPNDIVHQNICSWAVWLRQRLYASMRPMLHEAYTLAGGAGLGVSLHLVCYAWPVILSEHELECAFGAKMPSN